MLQKQLHNINICSGGSGNQRPFKKFHEPSFAADVMQQGARNVRAAERYRVLHAPLDVTARGARATAHVIEKDIDVGTVVVRRGDDKSTALLLIHRVCLGSSFQKTRNDRVSAQISSVCPLSTQCSRLAGEF